MPTVGAKYTAGGSRTSLKEKQAVSEIQKRGVGGISARAHVQRYPTGDYCISCNLLAPECIPNFNTIGLAVTELQQDKFFVTPLRRHAPRAVVTIHL